MRLSMKSALSVLLAGFVLVSLGALAYQSLKDDPVPPASSSPAAEADRFVVTYFHGKQRCPTCLRMERYTKEAIAETFAKEVAAKRLEVRVIDTSLPANQHYIQDYDLGGNSLIVAEFKGGRQIRWKNLENIWDLAEDEMNFKLYVTSEVRVYLGAP